ncbi:MAG: YraN family protein [Gordonibacter sp.]|uniref:YraN family protein n=1 Tax=Gordonibacter sp. TaxID=1968902 RepID=UPI002B3C2BC7|nr:YraN family protein [Gordonibacter sp.]
MEAISNDKAMNGIERYLERRGMYITERGWAHGKDKIDFVVRDDDELVFVAARIRENTGKGLPEEDSSRKSFEKVAAAYLAEHPDIPEGRVRFDIVSMLILSDSRALIRHHMNATSVAGEDLS